MVVFSESCVNDCVIFCYSLIWKHFKFKHLLITTHYWCCADKKILIWANQTQGRKEGLNKQTPTLSTEPVVEMVRLTMPLTTIRTTSRSITMRFTTQVEKTAPRWDNYTILWLRNNTLQTVLLNMNLQCKRDETEEGQGCAVIISKVRSQRNTIFLLRKALLKMPNLQYVGVQDQLYDSCR